MTYQIIIFLIASIFIYTIVCHPIDITVNTLLYDQSFYDAYYIIFFKTTPNPTKSLLHQFSHHLLRVKSNVTTSQQMSLSSTFINALPTLTKIIFASHTHYFHNFLFKLKTLTFL